MKKVLKYSLLIGSLAIPATVIPLTMTSCSVNVKDILDKLTGTLPDDIKNQINPQPKPDNQAPNKGDQSSQGSQSNQGDQGSSTVNSQDKQN